MRDALLAKIQDMTDALSSDTAQCLSPTGDDYNDLCHVIEMLLRCCPAIDTEIAEALNLLISA